MEPPKWTMFARTGWHISSDISTRRRMRPFHGATGFFFTSWSGSFMSRPKNPRVCGEENSCIHFEENSCIHFEATLPYRYIGNIYIYIQLYYFIYIYIDIRSCIHRSSTQQFLLLSSTNLANNVCGTTLFWSNQVPSNYHQITIPYGSKHCLRRYG